MQKTNTLDRAWLKVQHKKSKYIPVTIVKRTSQLRALVCDNDTVDPKYTYEVDYAILIPRSSLEPPQDLVDMEFMNGPELQRCLAEGEDKKYKYMGENLYIDTRDPFYNSPESMTFNT